MEAKIDRCLVMWLVQPLSMNQVFSSWELSACDAINKCLSSFLSSSITFACCCVFCWDCFFLALQYFSLWPSLLQKLQLKRGLPLYQQSFSTWLVLLQWEQGEKFHFLEDPSAFPLLFLKNFFPFRFPELFPLWFAQKAPSVASTPFIKPLCSCAWSLLVNSAIVRLCKSQDSSIVEILASNF